MCGPTRGRGGGLARQGQHRFGGFDLEPRTRKEGTEVAAEDAQEDLGELARVLELGIRSPPPAQVARAPGPWRGGGWTGSS